MKTNPKLEELRNDPLTKLFAAFAGLNLDELIDSVEEQEKVDEAAKKIVEKEIEKEDNSEPIEEAEEAPKELFESDDNDFVMSVEQLKTFIDKYLEFQSNVKRLEYQFGIEINDSANGFGFLSAIDEIVWDFVRIIFGEDNVDDIADYVFGNSNFDSVEMLYNELI